MVSKEVKLIEYSEKVDFGNCITHAVGAVLAVFGLIMLILKADGFRDLLSSIIYGTSVLAVYAVSATYHGLKQGESKRRARLIDHSTVPFLIAGTATPCALITLYEISVPHGITVLVLAWFCTLFGLFSKIFFFEKLKAVTMAVYIGSCFIMVCCALPLLGEIDLKAFGGIMLGNIFYLIGACFCGLGIKRPALHIVFHIFVLLASLAHFAVIYLFII